MSNPWDIPPMPEKGDEDINTTYASVGRALSAWERFESHLAFMFIKFLNLNPRGDVAPAIRAFGVISSYRNRIDLIRTASQAFMHSTQPPEGLEEQLSTLLNMGDRYAPRRNEIAHGIVLNFKEAFLVDNKITAKANGFVLAPHYHNPKKQNLVGRVPIPTYLYTSKEIDYFKDRFEELEPQALNFMKELNAFRKTLPSIAFP